MLSADDFSAFFEEVHGCEPFPWQTRLLRYVLDEGKWPSMLDLPTGSGKTAAIDIAVFHLSLEAELREARRAPVRIAFVVDRRLVVDDAFGRATKLADALDKPSGPATERVSAQLRKLSGDGPALIARRLRGGIPREDDWARTPGQPTVLCSTVDQVGSRLLFRGYGVSDSMKPVHAGLLGSDSLILLDEAHLAEPFRQTLEWVNLYQGSGWREVDTAAPWGLSLLTATPGDEPGDGFFLDDRDKVHPVLQARLSASKPVRLVPPTQPPKVKAENGRRTEDDAELDGEVTHRAALIVGEVRRALSHFKTPQHGASTPAIGVVVNRVARARAVFELLRRELTEEIASGSVGDPVLMIGPARPLDRDELANALGPIRTRTWNRGEQRVLHKPLVVVATQCIEVGVDIDLDGVITEAAPLDALRQRFGRLNRAGRAISPYAAIVTLKSDISARFDDPVYGGAIRAAWEYLTDRQDRREGGAFVVDFGLNAFSARVKEEPVPQEALSRKDDAPVLLPAHLDLLSQTSPIPTADPEVALYLHGTDRQPDSITVVWRADLDPRRLGDEETRRLLALAPPRSAEAIQLPLWVVRRWLLQRRANLGVLADVAAAAPDVDDPSDSEARPVFRWKGDGELSQWVKPLDLRPGDTVVAPASYGGLDEFGWNPESKTDVADIGQKAATPFAGRRFTVRVGPRLVGDSVNDEALADALAGSASQHWRDLRSALLGLDLPETLKAGLRALDDAKAGNVVSYADVYGSDDNGRPRGVVFVAPLGIKGGKTEEDGRPNATEDDVSGSTPGYSLPLERHCQDVAQKAADFAAAAGVEAARISDLKLAGHLHDAGKADARFQAWLHYGDPLGPDPDHILAKSGRFLPRRARNVSGLPEHWRHEALSVRLARLDQRFVEANDPELVLWLIGSHHGRGRPLFPHHDATEKAPDLGPQSLAFDWQGVDWPNLFVRLKARYGTWELARMEAILRLADHRASEETAGKEGVS